MANHSDGFLRYQSGSQSPGQPGKEERQGDSEVVGGGPTCGRRLMGEGMEARGKAPGSEVTSELILLNIYYENFNQAQK